MPLATSQRTSATSSPSLNGGSDSSSIARCSITFVKPASTTRLPTALKASPSPGSAGPSPGQDRSSRRVVS